MAVAHASPVVNVAALSICAARMGLGQAGCNYDGECDECFHGIPSMWRR